MMMMMVVQFFLGNIFHILKNRKIPMEARRWTSWENKYSYLINLLNVKREATYKEVIDICANQMLWWDQPCIKGSLIKLEKDHLFLSQKWRYFIMETFCLGRQLSSKLKTLIWPFSANIKKNQSYPFNLRTIYWLGGRKYQSI